MNSQSNHELRDKLEKKKERESVCKNRELLSLSLSIYKKWQKKKSATKNKGKFKSLELRTWFQVHDFYTFFFAFFFFWFLICYQESLSLL